jgi:iodotyrosine deiodinase
LSPIEQILFLVDFLDDAEFENEFEDEKVEICGVTTDVKHVSLEFNRLSAKESEARSFEFYQMMDKRRTVRFFSPELVPPTVIHNIVKAAGTHLLHQASNLSKRKFKACISGTAPSGAHTEPWTYVIVSDPKIKKQIRDIVESEEKLNYTRRTGKFASGKTKSKNA